MNIVITSEAAASLNELPRTIRERMEKLMLRLQGWPIVSGAKTLRGNLAGSYRMRTGDYRLQFHLESSTVVIDKIGHRDGFYED